MFMHLQAAIVFIVFLLAVIAFLTAGVLIVKIYALRQRRKSEQALNELKGYLGYVQAHIDEEERLRVPPKRLHRLERNVLQNVCLEWLEKLSGTHREKIIALCEDLGLIEMNRRLLRSRFHHRRIKAAFCLGMMRVKEAVPDLLALMNRQAFDSTTFILARAVAKAAVHANEINEMIRFLIRHRTNIHPYIADMLQESSVDCRTLFIEYLREKDPELVKVALVGLEDEAVPGLSHLLRPLMNDADRNVRFLAFKRLFHSGAWQPDDIANGMRCEDAEIRTFVAEWIGRAGLVSHAETLKRGVCDPEWQVSRASIQSLLQLGETGFEKLCQAALEWERTGEGNPPYEILREELQKNAREKRDLHTRMQYNRRLYLYRKYFGKQDLQWAG